VVAAMATTAGLVASGAPRNVAPKAATVGKIETAARGGVEREFAAGHRRRRSASTAGKVADRARRKKPATEVWLVSQNARNGWTRCSCLSRSEFGRLDIAPWGNPRELFCTVPHE